MKEIQSLASNVLLYIPLPTRVCLCVCVYVSVCVCLVVHYLICKILDHDNIYSYFLLIKRILEVFGSFF